MNEIPRRIRIDLATPAEKAIRDAIAAVEAGPAEVRMTDAVILLGAALESVADVVDGVQPITRRYWYPKPELEAQEPPPAEPCTDEFMRERIAERITLIEYKAESSLAACREQLAQLQALRPMIEQALRGYDSAGRKYYPYDVLQRLRSLLDAAPSAKET